MTTQRAGRREWTAEDWNDMQHTGPETLAGQFIDGACGIGTNRIRSGDV